MWFIAAFYAYSSDNAVINSYRSCNDRCSSHLNKRFAESLVSPRANPFTINNPFIKLSSTELCGFFFWGVQGSVPMSESVIKGNEAMTPNTEPQVVCNGCRAHNVPFGRNKVWVLVVILSGSMAE